jgi:hypothetical protein
VALEFFEAIFCIKAHMFNSFFLTLFAECEILEQGSELEASLRQVRVPVVGDWDRHIVPVQQVHLKTNPNYSQFIEGSHIAILKMKIVSGKSMVEIKHL